MTRESICLLRRLHRDRRGLALIEFALIAPVFLLLLVGAFDIGHTLYMTTDLQGVTQKAARDSSLQGAQTVEGQTKIDDRVRSMIRKLNRNANVAIERRFFKTFGSAAARVAEDWTDTNGNKKCDAGENYFDANSNNVWDKDGGDAGQGGAQDRVRYTVTVTYPRLLPLARFLPVSPTVTLTAVSIMANQPYDDQTAYDSATAKTKQCP